MLILSSPQHILFATQRKDVFLLPPSLLLPSPP